MLSCFAAPISGSSTSIICTTFPSAGETNTFLSLGTVLSGSRKKYKLKSTNTKSIKNINLKDWCPFIIAAQPIRISRMDAGIRIIFPSGAIMKDILFF